METNRSGSFVYSQVAFTFASDVFTTPRTPSDAYHTKATFSEKNTFGWSDHSGSRDRVSSAFCKLRGVDIYRCSLASMVQKYLLTGTKVQILTAEEQPGSAFSVSSASC